MLGRLALPNLRRPPQAKATQSIHVALSRYSAQTGGDPMRYDSDIWHLYDGSRVIVVMAELFLRAHGFRVYSIGTIFDPMASICGSPHVKLYVASEDYRDALAVLVFVGVVDGFYYVNATSLLLGRDVHDLLPTDLLASMQRSAARLQME